MKCIKNGADIKRVQDNRAEKMVKQGWSYCCKEEWKNKGRKIAQEDMPVVAEKKIIRTKKEKKMKNREEIKEVKAEKVES